MSNLVEIGRVTLDSFRNLVANLNTNRDKQQHGTYYLRDLPDNTLSDIYRGSWIGRKVVSIPAQDATRKWREWMADTTEIEAIEKEEKRLKLQQKTKLALQIARCFGGAGIYFSIRGDRPEEPLDLERVKQGALEFCTVLSRDVLVAGDLEDDALMEGYGKPKYYTVSSQSAGTVRIHPSRLAIFLGNEILTPHTIKGVYQGWGDSVLQAAYDAIQNADSVAGNVASLVYEAKVDILQIPNLANEMRDPRTRNLLVERIELAAQLKGNQGMLVLDKEESYEQKSFTFAGLTDISMLALQAAAGSADIPVTRFLGQSPAGMNSTGESDLKNYYDMVSDIQTAQVTPALYHLDECLIRSVLGSRPDDVYFEWSSLWQMSDEQKSKISKETADTIKALVESGLFPEEDLAIAAAALLVEHSILPNFELDLNALRGKLEEEEAMAAAAIGNMNTEEEEDDDV